MTRKDYVAIARAFALTNDYIRLNGKADAAEAEKLKGATFSAMNVADSLAMVNPRFDRARFLKACGVQS